MSEQSDMEPRTFRISLWVPLIAVVELTVVGYFTLYNAGVVEWKLLPRVGTIDLHEPDEVLGICVLFALGVLLLAFARVKVHVTDERLSYRGLILSRALEWKSVTQLNCPPYPSDLVLFTHTARISISPRMCIVHEGELAEIITEHVKARAPDAIIDESRAAFWPRREPRT